MTTLRHRQTIFAGATAVVLLLVLFGFNQSIDIVRERTFDAMTSLLKSSPSQQDPVVVDIDRQSLAEFGPWPWSRARLAQVIGRIADGKPKALGIDILLDQPDDRSPAAIARQLASETGNPEVRRLAETLPDGDQLLAAALARVPTVLGVALDPDQDRGDIATPPLLVRGPVRLGSIWRAKGAIPPVQPLMTRAAGLGAIVVPGDADGEVRRVPLLIQTARQVVPGMEVELLRVKEDAANLFLTSASSTLRVGDMEIPMGSDAMLRLIPGDSSWPQRTISAATLLRSTAVVPAISGRIVFLGSSAPEVGGLRVTAEGALVPSVQIHADAMRQLLSGLIVIRPTWIPKLELVATLLAVLLGLWLGLTRSPLIGALLVLGICVGWWLASFAALFGARELVDPIVAPAAACIGFIVTALLRAADTARRAAAIRRRFEQHLAPEVVRRIADDPEMLRLEGETRNVTVLFTDIEGFTSMTERSEPILLVRVLDDYFSRLSQKIVEHGGMVDKIVGDAVHALFNAPVDLDAHEERAVRCAIELSEIAERFRSVPLAKQLGFGRTRIGIETGTCIIGDVGGGRKLDYTAHGTAINTAARLEAANKVLGSTICIGPGTASAVSIKLRPLGAIALRGRSSPQEVYEPWPEVYTADDRAEYLASYEASRAEATLAAGRFDALSVKFAHDPVPRLFAERLRAEAPAQAGAAS